MNERGVMWQSNDTLTLFLWASLCCNDCHQFLSTSSICTRRCSRGWVSLRSLMAECKLGMSRSMGIMASTPYTKWKGVKPVDVFTIMCYAHGAENSIWFQLVLWLFTMHCNIVLSTLLIASTCPLEWGYYGEANSWVNLR